MGGAAGQSLLRRHRTLVVLGEGKGMRIVRLSSYALATAVVLAAMIQTARAQLSEEVFNRSVDVTSVVVMVAILYFIISAMLKRDRCDREPGLRGDTKGFVSARRSQNKRLARQNIIPKKSLSAAQQMQKRAQTAAEKAEKERADREKKDKDGKDSPGQQRPMTEEQRHAAMSRRGTASSTVGKGETRRAHTMDQRPSTSSSNGSRNGDSGAKPKLRDPMDLKIPSATRNKYLEEFFKHYVKTLPTRSEAIESAEEEEKVLKDNAKHKNAYCIQGCNTLRRLRDEGKNGGQGAKSTKISHQAMLVGKHGKDVTVGARRGSRDGHAHSAKEFEATAFGGMKKYFLTEDQLKDNGFPRWESSAHSRVSMVMHGMDKARGKRCFVPDTDLSRVCVRCSKEFKVNKNGSVQSAECVYHWGRSNKTKAKQTGNTWETLYSCCGGDATVPGCAVGSSHVFDTLRESDLSAFEETPPSWGDLDERNRRIYALDCEMVYTTWGPALARLTVIDVHGKAVLDVKVRPPHAVTCANTRFSGLTMDDINSATATLNDARRALFQLANADTVLIGHSLESDLKAMRVVHNRIVDTSVVFPHKYGPPYKRALRTLACEHLRKIIQEDVSGHDSEEDARCCLDLMLWHLRSNDHLRL